MVDREAFQEFLVECHEGLDQVERDLVGLEATPDDGARIASIFRIIHTIKGGSGFVGLVQLGSITHAGEALLAQIREGLVAFTSEIAGSLLVLVDRVRGILRSVETDGTEGERPHDDLILDLMSLAAPLGGGFAPPMLAVAIPQPLASPPPPPPPPPAPAASDEPAAPERAASDSYVRVDVGLLDKLMNLVGELVLARNQILPRASESADAGLHHAAQRLHLITAELQEHVMKARMQPIGNVWAKLPRVVRDLAVTCGKQVRVEMHGRHTELDRTIIEAIKDPLTHVVRNSIDHGIEPPSTRLAAGKPRTGTLSLRAYHEGGRVNIEISDDGGGLDLLAIRAKAVERGLVPAERAARLTDHELAQLIFAPGFSTARAVTAVSGRGVGMDVVRTNIERIGGTAEVVSERGSGTTIRIRIPLTLAIMPALFVASGGQHYAIPQAHLVELVRAESPRALESIRGTPVFRLRGRLLPIVSLGGVLGTPRRDDGGPLDIIVLAVDGHQFGLVVDDVGDTEEIVVKPLGRELGALAVYAGATIRGDGRVALILDIMGLASHANVLGSATAAAADKQAAAEAPPAAPQRLLLFALGDRAPMAVPLDQVARLEELSHAQLEHAGDRRSGLLAVQYRDRILPLVDLCALAGEQAPADKVPVVVYTDGDASVGFIVGRIVDVVEHDLHVDRCAARTGVAGAAIVDGRITEVLDVHAVIREHAPWFATAGAT